MLQQAIVKTLKINWKVKSQQSRRNKEKPNRNVKLKYTPT